MSDGPEHFYAQVFAGAVSALAVMTVLSAALGWAAPNLVGWAVAKSVCRLCRRLGNAVSRAQNCQ